MSRSLQIGNIVDTDYPQGYSISIEVDTSALQDWCLQLSLLDKGLVKSVTLADAKFRPRLEISLSLQRGDRGRGVVHWRNGVALITISKRELDYWQHWFLRYYRDGISDVDHIDVEIEGGGKGERSLDLTFKLPYKVPLPSKEARKILGI